MQSIIALTNDNKTFTDLFYYCTLYGYRFKITGSTEEALAYFAQHRSSVFIVECSDMEQNFLKFARHLSPSLSVMAICDGGGWTKKLLYWLLKTERTVFCVCPAATANFITACATF